MIESVQSFAIGTLGLDLLLLVSLALTLSRPELSQLNFYSLKPLILVAIAGQTIHLTEETATGFYDRFPGLLGLTPWPLWLFLSFNLAWLAIWTTGLLLKRPSGFVVWTIWFLAIASAANAVAHPVFSIAAGGYFPGLATSPLVGILGVLLIRQLISSTEEMHPP